ncbi:prepilin-type N-terminal cleavage/methylation domain-containing protein [Flavobacterium beibuense]|uniref:Prepilin-type N-terminal cleavage/methylation domain-containing protein n=1 Tax=Flavobacterium beibuense TaxID=657326 RepID=A0A444W807_9FLAO|nr:prepilin-type N-terminal cleavage/methylation domain-containing protein [Flavobacterium beibuense]RYJ42037.1 hypothetical protein NU09_2441 [Flavobacterium beibuense]
MQNNKVQSFTLSELLVVVIITVIVVGLAFSVLNLVQKQIHGIRKNFDKTTELALFEQQLYQDFNNSNSIIYQDNKIHITGLDTVYYTVYGDYSIRNNDTIPLRLQIIKTYLSGKEVKKGNIDGLLLSAEQEIPDYSIFVSGEKDASNLINQDGF